MRGDCIACDALFFIGMLKTMFELHIRSFDENFMATLVAMATVHEKFQMAFPMKVLSQF